MEPLLWAALFVLAASFLSNVSPFVGASYTLLATVELTFLGFTIVNFLLVIIVSAFGATLAKLAIYFGAFEFKGSLLKNRNVRLLGRFSSTRGFYLVLFVAALIPVFPFDDFIYIGAAATSASLGIMMSVTLWAKILKSLVEISLEFTVLRGLATILGGSQILLTVALTAVFIGIGIFLYKVDWELALNRLGVDVAGRQPVRAGATGPNVIVSASTRSGNAGVAQPGQRREA